MCDRRLARLAKKYQELPGQELLRYQDSPKTFKVIESGDVNQYLKEITGEDFTAKDFRTWGATVFAANDLYCLGPAASEQERKRKISQCVKEIASKLGNTPAVCRKYYIDPKIIKAYSNNRLFELMNRIDSEDGGNGFFLSREETAVFNLLNNSRNGRTELIES